MENTQQQRLIEELEQVNADIDALYQLLLLALEKGNSGIYEGATALCRYTSYHLDDLIPKLKAIIG